MRRSAVATPCPVPASSNHLLRADLDDTTTTIDFTTELRASFKNAKPRRLQRQSVQFTIHEDENEGQKSNTSRTTLSRPPRRTHVAQENWSIAEEKTKLHVEDKHDLKNSARRHSTNVLSQAPRRPVSRLSVVQESGINESIGVIEPSVTGVLRPARRGTFYIPNEDTTMPSMFMGIFSPIKDFDLASEDLKESKSAIETMGMAAQTAVKKRTRKSVIGGSALRGALKPTRKPVQQTLQTQDRYGQGGGKENLPPGATEKCEGNSYAGDSSVQLSKGRMDLTKLSDAIGRRSSTYLPPMCSAPKHDPPRASMVQRSQPRTAQSNRPTVQQSLSKPVTRVSRETAFSQPAPVVAPKPRVPTRFVIPVVQAEAALQKYPVLREDIADPTVYEEEWLRHQEIVITQLVNNLFSASRSDSHFDHISSRSKLLENYCSPTMVLMHQRLQAALLYGALSVPQDTLDQGARLQTDLGLRKRFTDLWLNNYDLSILEIGLEVIVGRECRSRNSCTPEGISSSCKLSRSGLRNFIEAFLIRNEDGKPNQDVKCRTAWSYQRTILRSLLLIKVLDLSKTVQRINMKGCLFQPSSPFKTSAAVLQALTQMLNPAAGDPTRGLGHMGYSVSHVQHPLEEFHYQIENLAVDFRDGVLLTRIVEILLYPSASEAMEQHFDGGTTTILMPEGDSLEFTDGQDWPLSQHLKMPCQTRVVRLWNVQLALAALKNVKGMNVLAHNITPEDIVDGFREKTIRLLWALVGKWGISGLINWHDLRWETRRLERNGNLTFTEDLDDEFDADDCSFEACKGLLKRWSRAVASSKGIEIHNFTTSFADGKAFKAIVNEYEPYIIAEEASSKRALSLQDRLTQLGCSAQFSELFAEPKQTHIFSRDFVFAALAFLCSRLLAPSQRSRAATVVQQAWRRKWSRIKAVRQAERKNVAAACADFVNLKRKTSAVTHLIGRGATAQVGRPKEEVAFHNPMSPSDRDMWLSL